MKNELLDKVKDFLALIITIILDALLILVIAGLTELLKYVLVHNIFKEPIEDADNFAFVYIYKASKYFLIIVFTIYVSFDIISQIIRSYRRLKAEI